MSEHPIQFNIYTNYRYELRCFRILQLGSRVYPSQGVQKRENRSFRGEICCPCYCPVLSASFPRTSTSTTLAPGVATLEVPDQSLENKQRDFCLKRGVGLFSLIQLLLNLLHKESLARSELQL